MIKRFFAILLGIFVSTSSQASDIKSTELPTSIYKKVTDLSDEGDLLAEKQKYEEAIKKYQSAMELLPEPKENWEAATWLLVAIGDAYFLSKNYSEAQSTFSKTMNYPGAIENPFIHLRLGQSFFELGNREGAANELARAYMGAGKEIFSEENPKYFEYLKSVLKPPASGVW